jgi:hypothetical protein
MDIKQLERELGRKIVAGDQVAGFAQIVGYVDVLGREYYSHLYMWVKTHKRSIDKPRVVLKTIIRDDQILLKASLN